MPSAILIVTVADAQSGLPDHDAAAAVPNSGTGNFAVPLSASGSNPATHLGANWAGLTDQQFADLELYFGNGNPYGRVMRDAETQTFWDVLTELGLKRIAPALPTG